MPRPRTQRRICFEPTVTYYKPRGIPMQQLHVVELSAEELEALRLKHVELLDQHAAAKHMHTSQSTFQRILTSGMHHHNSFTTRSMKILKFGAVWCTGCLVMKPRWEQIEREHPWLQTQFYDFDTDGAVVRQWGVDKEQGSLPTCIFLDKEGKEFLRLHGERSKKELIEHIQQNRER